MNKLVVDDYNNKKSDAQDGDLFLDSETGSVYMFYKDEYIKVMGQDEPEEISSPAEEINNNFNSIW
jgi:hypothetical protein